MSVADYTTLRLERTFDARPEEVFDAWTNPDVLRRWWATGAAGSTPIAEVDLREGGAYRLAMRDGESGALHTVQGEYREVLRPERLVYTWAWVEEDGSLGHVSTVTVQFRGEQERTTVLLEHTDLPSAESRERHGVGWAACLENLAHKVFGPSAQPA